MVCDGQSQRQVQHGCPRLDVLEAQQAMSCTIAHVVHQMQCRQDSLKWETDQNRADAGNLNLQVCEISSYFWLDSRHCLCTCRLRMSRSPFSAWYTPSLQSSSCRSWTPVHPIPHSFVGHPKEHEPRLCMQPLRDWASAYTLDGKPLHEGLHLTHILKSLAGFISEVMLGDSSRD